MAIFSLCSFQRRYCTQTPSPPVLKCASTDSAGAVTLQWEIPNPGSVDHYNIYWSNSAAGPYNKISFPNDGSSVTYKISSVNGNNLLYYFYMRSYNAAGDSSVASSLVSNILLQMTATSKGIADLTWNAFDPSITGIYNLTRTDTSGNSSTVYSGTGLSFRDIITSPYCDSMSLSYRVEFTGGCMSYSNIKTGEFLDDNPPTDVVMDSMSIGLNGRPVISWEASTVVDVAGYFIQQLSASGVWEDIGFAAGRLTTFFSADSLKQCPGVKTFVIITADQCGNKSTGVSNYSNPLNTLMLGQPNVDECHRTAMLSWNAYKNMKPAFGEYRIYRNENLGSFALIGTTAEGITTFTDTLGFIPGSKYSYYIRAVSQDGQKSSRSCENGFIFNGQANPDTISLNYVSVVNNQYVGGNFHFGPPETVSSIRVYRADASGGPYTIIDSIFPGGPADIPFSDPTATVNSQSFYYKVVALNNCNLETIWSQLSRTILLRCNANNDQSNALTWNEYEGWANIDHYGVYRLVNDVPDPANPITTTLPGTTSYTDLPAASQQAGNIISYYVTAFEGNVAFPDSSVSNIVEALRQPLVTLPNAFVPRGLNNIFRPIMDFVDDGNYRLLIFNKWGQQVFVSTDRNIGWDGKFKGEYAPSGIYFYHLQYNSFAGDTFTKTGSLMLVE